MNDSNLLRALGQVSGDTAGGIFREHIRGAVLQMISSVIAEEVTELCGPKHQPDHSSHFRAGTARGSILHEGEKESVVRPRVRRRKSDGSSEEVALETYQAARCPDQLRASVITCRWSQQPGGRLDTEREFTRAESFQCFAALDERRSPVR